MRMSSYHPASTAASSAAAVSAAPPLLLPCRSCYRPTVVSQLRPYRYLAQHAFESESGHAACLCPECDHWLHPAADRADVWETVDGKDKFCRLCGDGDRSLTAYVCDEEGCPYTFCVLCIRANGGERMLREVYRDNGWVCFNHKQRPAGCEAKLLDSVDLVCRAERGQFTHRNVFDCFNTITHQPIPSFTYLTPKAKQRWQPHQPHQPPPLSSVGQEAKPKRVLSTCLYKWTSSAPKHHVKYLYGLMENMQHFPKRWPGWTLRLYYDNSLILPAAAPEDELDHVHSHSSEEAPADAVDNSQYTQSLAEAFRVLLATFSNHPSIELAWYNFPYLQDSSHHHHGHIGMAARFLALADLGVTASHVVVADLDNLWYETACKQAEDFEKGKRYHRYHDVDYCFPLAGGSFNARVERLQPNTPDASPFADIESQLHAFFTAHHRAPEALRDSYGERVDESECIAPAQHSTKRGRADGTQQQSDGSEKQRKSKRVAMRSAATATSQRDNNTSRPVNASIPRSAVDREELDRETHSEEERVTGRRLSKRISAAAAESKRQAEERAREKQRQVEQTESRDASMSSDDYSLSGGPRSAKQRRELHHYFFGYSCDQVFLQERVWPTVKLSCATSVIQHEHIKPEMRQRNKQDESEVAELDADPRQSRCSEAEYVRREAIRSRSRERSRWQAQKQKRLFKHFFGLVDERLFPAHKDIREWLSRRVGEVWSTWRQHSSHETAHRSSSSGPVSSWHRRVKAPLTADIYSLVTAPGHLSAVSAAFTAHYAQHFSPPLGAGYIGPPSATSPIDFAARWSAALSQQDSHSPTQHRLKKSKQQSSPSRQLSFSGADAPFSAQVALSPSTT